MNEATIRAAIFDVQDAGWKCADRCNVKHPWDFDPNAESETETEHRVKFVDAVIARMRDSERRGTMKNPESSNQSQELDSESSEKERQLTGLKSHAADCGECARAIEKFPDLELFDHQLCAVGQQVFRNVEVAAIPVEHTATPWMLADGVIYANIPTLVGTVEGPAIAACGPIKDRMLGWIDERYAENPSEIHAANADLIVNAVNSHADLIAERDALRAALEAKLTMEGRGGKPRKLDEALSWRENDEKAEAMARAALSLSKPESE